MVLFDLLTIGCSLRIRPGRPREHIAFANGQPPRGGGRAQTDAEPASWDGYWDRRNKNACKTYFITPARVDYCSESMSIRSCARGDAAAVSLLFDTITSEGPVRSNIQLPASTNHICYSRHVIFASSLTASSPVPDLVPTLLTFPSWHGAAPTDSPLPTS